MSYVRHEEKLLPTVPFKADAAIATSDTFICDKYDEFLLMCECAKEGTPGTYTHLKTEVRFHDEDGGIYVYNDGPFSNLIEGRGGTVTTSIPCKKAYRGRCAGHEMSVKITADGALSTTNYYKGAARVQFLGKE